MEWGTAYHCAGIAWIAEPRFRRPEGRFANRPYKGIHAGEDACGTPWVPHHLWWDGTGIPSWKRLPDPRPSTLNPIFGLLPIPDLLESAEDFGVASIEVEGDLEDFLNLV